MNKNIYKLTFDPETKRWDYLLIPSEDAYEAEVNNPLFDPLRPDLLHQCEGEGLVREEGLSASQEMQALPRREEKKSRGKQWPVINFPAVFLPSSTRIVIHAPTSK